jgi:CDP-glucose 4,6-dehydratase
VLEPLAGYLRLAEALAGDEGERFACAWNFGPDEGDARPVSWLVERLLALWHAAAAGVADWEHDRRARPHEATLLRLDASRARQRLGWAPRLDLATTLAWVVEWHRAWRSGGDVRRLTEEQIGRYEEA